MGEDAYKLTLARACLSWWKERTMRKALAGERLGASPTMLVYQEVTKMDAEAMANEFMAWLADYQPGKGA